MPINFGPGFSPGFSSSVATLNTSMPYYSDPTIVIIDWSPGGIGGVNQQPHVTTARSDLTLPVNCVLDGQQREPLSKLMGLDGAITGPLRGIFKE